MPKHNFVDWNGFLSLPGNEPLARPGAYLFIHLPSDKRYVGISQNLQLRLRQATYGSATKIKNALTKHGRSSFLVLPLYYSLDGTAHLPAVEVELIKDWNSIHPAGYNILEATGKVGPYGPEFSKLLTNVFANPRIRSNMIAGQREWAAKRKGLPIPGFTPEARARGIVKTRKTMSDPSWRAQRSALAKKLSSTSEMRATRSRNMRGRVWITNGIHNRRMLPNNTLPTGWHLGRTAKRPQVRLTDDDVMIIRQALARGVEGSFLAAQYSVSRSLISMIHTGKRRPK
jgi:hypothetical protein